MNFTRSKNRSARRHTARRTRWQFSKFYNPDEFNPKSLYRNSLTVSSLIADSLEQVPSALAHALGKTVDVISLLPTENRSNIYFYILRIDGILYDARISRFAPALYSFIGNEILENMEDYEVRLGFELESCIPLLSKKCLRNPSKMLPEIKERLIAIYAANNLKNYTLRDKKQKWYQLIVIYINYILKNNILSTSQKFIDAFIEQYPLIGIKLRSKTDAIDYIIDVPKLLASKHYYEPRATSTIGFAVDRYDIPILTMDASLSCTDTTVKTLFNTNNADFNFSVHCEFISPITVYDESVTDAIYLLLEGIRNKCFEPNGSTGFHINTSIWSKSRGIQIGLSDQFLCNSFLDEYLPYEAANYETLRASGIHIIEKTNPYTYATERKVVPDYYARPLAKEAKDRFFHTYYASILRTTDDKPVTVDAFAEKYYKIFSNLNKRNSSRTDKYIAVLHKGGGLLEFRLFPSVSDFNSLRSYIDLTVNILRRAYIDYIKRHLEICAELNTLASEVYVRNISQVNIAPFYYLYDEESLVKRSVWNPVVLSSQKRIAYNNANIFTYRTSGDLDYLDETELISDYLVSIFFYQHTMYQLTIMDPFGVREEHLYRYLAHKNQLYVMQPANEDSIYLVTYEVKYSKKMGTALATITLAPSRSLNT